MDDGTIGVVIIDPHSMVADGLATLVNGEPDLAALGVANTLESGLDLLGRVEADVLVLALRFPSGSSEQTAEVIRDRWPDLAVIFLTGYDPGDALGHAIEIGCLGFLVKDLPAEALLGAIRQAHRGELVVHAPLLRDAIRGYKSPTPSRFALSARELEVLQRLATGASTEEISQELFLSVHTVRNHVSNILTKLGVHSKLEAVTRAAHDQLIFLA